FLIAMVAVLGYGFLEASVHAKLANLTTNIGALLVFGVQGEVWWLLGAVLAVANVLGGYLGARLALRLGSGFVRIVFLVVTGALVGLDVTVRRFRGPSPWRSGWIRRHCSATSATSTRAPCTGGPCSSPSVPTATRATPSS